MGRSRSLALGLAAGGVVGGHALAYALAYPLAAVRRSHLEETGHQGFQILLVLGFAAAGVAVVSTFVRAARREGLPPSIGSLLGLQVGLFVALELAERGLDPGAALSDPAVVLGLPVQAALAVALAWLARGVVAVAQHLTDEPVRVRHRRSAPTPRPVRVAVPHAPDPVALGPRRAPPSLAIA
jgi:hypothetical protein